MIMDYGVIYCNNLQSNRILNKTLLTKMPLLLKLQSDIMKLNILKIPTNEVRRAKIKLSLLLSIRIKLDKIHVTSVSSN